MGKRKGRPVSGVLIIDKPQGITSNGALQKVKRLFNASKAGHTGALDPLATGVLPICFGEATKFSQYLLDAKKTYVVEATFGEIRETGDAEGALVKACELPSFDKNALLTVLSGFQGVIEQVPPIYSALKLNGKKLYEYARAGESVEIKARQVCIYHLDLLDIEAAEKRIHLRVECSKGTYIRSLVEDIGVALGSGAYVSQLRREVSGPYTLEQAVTIEQLERMSTTDNEGKALDDLLLPVDSAVQTFESLTLTEMDYQCLVQGKVVPSNAVENQKIYRLYRSDTGNFVGLGEKSDAGQYLKTKRLIATHSE